MSYYDPEKTKNCNFNELIAQISMCAKSMNLMNNFINDARTILANGSYTHLAKAGDDIQQALARTNADLLYYSQEIYKIMDIFNPPETKKL